MTPQEFINEVKRYSYKPGYTFKAVPAPHLMVELTLAVTVRDVRRPSEQIDLETHVLIWPEKIRSVAGELRNLIDQFEAHEADEWFMCDGKQVRQPEHQ